MKAELDPAPLYVHWWGETVWRVDQSAANVAVQATKYLSKNRVKIVLAPSPIQGCRTLYRLSATIEDEFTLSPLKERLLRNDRKLEVNVGSALLTTKSKLRTWQVKFHSDLEAREALLISH